ncbi:MAG: pyridoxamine 5'-phosphate oxidase family protein [Ilumatobacteraceae bacterium]
MSDIAMSRQEAEEFLAGVHVGVLAVDQPGHGPLTLPIWYAWQDGVALIGTGTNTLKARLLRAAGRATMLVQQETPPYKYVSLEGTVELVPDDSDSYAMASRYLGAEFGRKYADANPTGADSVVVRLTPDRWRTIDYSKAGG